MPRGIAVPSAFLSPHPYKYPFLLSFISSFSSRIAAEISPQSTGEDYKIQSDASNYIIYSSLFLKGTLFSSNNLALIFYKFKCLSTSEVTESSCNTTRIGAFFLLRARTLPYSQPLRNVRGPTSFFFNVLALLFQMTDEERSPIREGVTASSSDSSHQSSSRPSPRQKKLTEFMKPGWLRAHKKTVDSFVPQDRELISISDSSPRPIRLADDLGSVCPIEGRDDDAEKLNDLFTYLNENQTGPF